MELPLQCLFQRNFLGGISAAYLKCAWQNSFARVGVKENVGGRHCGWGFFENRIALSVGAEACLIWRCRMLVNFSLRRNL